MRLWFTANREVVKKMKKAYSDLYVKLETKEGERDLQHLAR